MGAHVSSLTERCDGSRRPRRQARHASERRRRAGGDDDELAVAGVAEAVRLAAVEEIGVAGGELVAAAVDFERQPALDDEARLFALVRQHLGPRLRARLVALVDHLQRAAVEIGADLTVGDGAAGDLGQLRGAIDDLLARRLGRGEEIGDADAERGEHLAERRHRGADPVGLDHRDRRVGDGGAARQLALRQAGAQRATRATAPPPRARDRRRSCVQYLEQPEQRGNWTSTSRRRHCSEN